MSLLSNLASLFSSRIKRNKVGKYNFGAIHFDNHELPIVGFKHPHIGPPKLFYVDSSTLQKLSGDD
jgi:hypothetical protein